MIVEISMWQLCNVTIQMTTSNWHGGINLVKNLKRQCHDSKSSIDMFHKSNNT